jgi:protein involved in polysaccharide export with SLBB domain
MAPTDCAKQFDVWSSLGPGAVVRVTTAGQVSFASIGSSFTVTTGVFSVSVEGSWWR